MCKKRYNVAASRAQDQLWVVHSMDRQTHLSPTDPRRRLLDHAVDPASSVGVSGGREHDVDSEFERLVLKDLKIKGYQVTPQWKVGSYKIDLVVEGTRGRLAVECDGDRLHTLDNLQVDMQRQAVLERLGWRFIRIPEGRNSSALPIAHYCLYMIAWREWISSLRPPQPPPSAPI